MKTKKILGSFLLLLLMLQNIVLSIHVSAEQVLPEIEEINESLQDEEDQTKEELTKETVVFEKDKERRQTGEEFSVTIINTEKINPVFIVLPSSATVSKESLPAGSQLIKTDVENQWMIRSSTPWETLNLQISFDTEGVFELRVEQSTLLVEIFKTDSSLIEDITPDSDLSNGIEDGMPNFEPRDSLTGLQKVILYDAQGNLVSGNAQFSMDNIVTLRRSSGSSLQRVNNTTWRLTNVGHFQGRSLDVLLYGPTEWSERSTGIWSIPGTNSAHTRNIRIQAVYSDSSAEVQAKILVPSFNHGPSGRFSVVYPEQSVFRLMHRQPIMSTITYTANTNRLTTSNLNSQSFGSIDAIIDNNTTITLNATRISGSMLIANTVIFFTGPGGSFNPEISQGKVIVRHLDENRNPLVEDEIIEGELHTPYLTTSMDNDNYELIETPTNAQGYFTSEETVVTYVYKRITVENPNPPPPMDPINPESEVDPENKPDLPEDQGLLSIDFASTFNFGSQAISAQETTYYAKPQRLLNEDGTVNEDEERPNYVQISDRRSETDRNGWQLAVTQNGQFETADEEPLLGARLSFTNQALATAQDGILPELQQTNPLTLVPGIKRVLVMAQGNEGAGTWIYRFGDQETAAQSIALTVPQGANPKAEQYKTSLTWELSAVPGNE